MECLGNKCRYGGNSMNVHNQPKDMQVYNLVKKGLDATSTRSKVIANNIANINTKGYKKFYVSFEENLKKTTGEVEMKTTDRKHINKGLDSSEVRIKQDKSSSMREDGNNVDIDNEMANQAANTLMYNALISQANSRISSIRYVITGGGR
jgi:flagellar basal-body rod protein FlgB